jgi:hypothetical protein
MMPISAFFLVVGNFEMTRRTAKLWQRSAWAVNQALAEFRTAG